MHDALNCVSYWERYKLSFCFLFWCAVKKFQVFFFSIHLIIILLRLLLTIIALRCQWTRGLICFLSLFLCFSLCLFIPMVLHFKLIQISILFQVHCVFVSLFSRHCNIGRTERMAETFTSTDSFACKFLSLFVIHRFLWHILWFLHPLETKLTNPFKLAFFANNPSFLWRWWNVEVHFN